MGNISTMITILKKKLHEILNMKVFYYCYLGFSFKMIMFEVENILSFEEKVV